MLPFDTGSLFYGSNRMIQNGLGKLATKHQSLSEFLGAEICTVPLGVRRFLGDRRITGPVSREFFAEADAMFDATDTRMPSPQQLAALVDAAYGKKLSGSITWGYSDRNYAQAWEFMPTAEQHFCFVQATEAWSDAAVREWVEQKIGLTDFVVFTRMVGSRTPDFKRELKRLK